MTELHEGDTSEPQVPPVQLPSVPSEELRPDVLPTWRHPDTPREPLGEADAGTPVDPDSV